MKSYTTTEPNVATILRYLAYKFAPTWHDGRVQFNFEVPDNMDINELLDEFERGDLVIADAQSLIVAHNDIISCGARMKTENVQPLKKRVKHSEEWVARRKAEGTWTENPPSKNNQPERW